jgi:hypothetical protein
MSSSGSPKLDIQVHERRAERWIAMTGSVLALLLPWLMGLQGIALVLIGLLSACVVAAGCYHAGWWPAPRRIQRVIWAADGHWLLLDASGRTREVRLAADTRTGPGCVWLRWQTTAPRSLLLLPCDVSADEMRRLAVRLRIDRYAVDALPHAAAI